MADTTRSTALEVVTALRDRLDVDSWPDPIFRWVSSSISESHRGKRYHTSEHCPRMASVTRPTWYDKPVSAIADQRCHECWLWTGQDVQQGLLTVTTKRVLAELEKLARAIDAGTATDPAAERHLLGRMRTVHVDVSAALSEILTIRARSREQVANPDEALHSAHSLLPATSVNGKGTMRPPSTEFDSDRLMITSMNAGWEEFLKALSRGDGIEEAGQAALDVILPLGDAFALRQLQGLSVEATQVGQVITLDDLIDVWREEASATTVKVVRSWADQTTARLRLSQQAGTVTVSVSRGAVPDWTLRGKLEDLATRYPVRLTDDATVVDVPAALAEHLTRTMSGRLVPSDRYTAGTLTVAAALQKEGLGMLEALATARAVAADPAAVPPLAA